MERNTVMDAEAIFIRLNSERLAELLKINGYNGAMTRDVLMVVTYDEGNWRVGLMRQAAPAIAALRA